MRRLTSTCFSFLCLLVCCTSSGICSAYFAHVHPSSLSSLHHPTSYHRRCDNASSPSLTVSLQCTHLPVTIIHVCINASGIVVLSLDSASSTSDDDEDLHDSRSRPSSSSRRGQTTSAASSHFTSTSSSSSPFRSSTARPLSEDPTLDSTSEFTISPALLAKLPKLPGSHHAPSIPLSIPSLSSPADPGSTALILYRPPSVWGNTVGLEDGIEERKARVREKRRRGSEMEMDGDHEMEEVRKMRHFSPPQREFGMGEPRARDGGEDAMELDP